MKRTLFVLLAGAAALSAADPKADLIKHLNASKAFSFDVANAMPAEFFNFQAEDKVQPPDRTFGEIMLHIGQSTYSYCSAVSGTKPPAAPAATDKAAVTQYISDAFDSCVKAATAEESLERVVKRGNNELAVRELFWSALSHDAHHRGQVEVYLRLKGVKPPAYRF